MEVIDMPISILLGSNPIIFVDKLIDHIKEVADYSLFRYTLCDAWIINFYLVLFDRGR